MSDSAIPPLKQPVLADWKVCRDLQDFEPVDIDIDSLVITGNRTCSWIMPKIRLSCDLSSCQAYP